jgi:hypothetical protein
LFAALRIRRAFGGDQSGPILDACLAAAIPINMETYPIHEANVPENWRGYLVGFIEKGASFQVEILRRFRRKCLFDYCGELSKEPNLAHSISSSLDGFWYGRMTSAPGCFVWQSHAIASIR